MIFVKGRINRRSLLVGWLTTLIIIVGLYISIVELIGMNSRFVYPIGYTLWYTLVFINASFYIRRLHDIGKSGYYYWVWCLLGLIPLIGNFLIVLGLIYLLLKKGEKKTNIYGRPPEPKFKSNALFSLVSRND